MKRLLACMLLAIGLSGPAALLADSEPRQLLARSVSAAAPLQLSSQDRAWLQQRQYLVLGSSRPDYPPFELNASLRDYEGISADYAGIIAEQLGINVEVRRFDNRHEAIAALREGSIDLLGSSNAFEAADAQLDLSTPYADDMPVIVTREGTSLKNTPDLAGLRLAMVDHYLPASTVRNLYPKAQLSLYRSTLAGLAAVDLGEADAYLGDAISTDFTIGKSYQGTLRIDHFCQVPAGAFAFALASDNPRLRRLVDMALARITDSERLNILRRWSSGHTSLLLQRHLTALSKEEEAWIAAHPNINVLVNTSLAPLTFNDAEHRPTGITLDLLKQISLRTGLHFSAVESDSAQAMVERLARGDAQMIGALGYGADRAKQLRYTRPYLVSPRVLVARSDSTSRHRPRRWMASASPWYAARRSGRCCNNATRRPGWWKWTTRSVSWRPWPVGLPTLPLAAISMPPTTSAMSSRAACASPACWTTTRPLPLSPWPRTSRSYRPSSTRHC